MDPQQARAFAWMILHAADIADPNQNDPKYLTD
jgi:hypothetical protein